MSICTNILFLRLLSFFQIFIQIIRFVVPIGLIVKLALDFYKNMITVNEPPKEVLKKSSNRVVAAIIVFIVPTIIRIFMSSVENIFSTSLDYQSCLTNISNIDYYIELKKLEEEQEEREKNELLKQKAEMLMNEQAKYIQNNKSTNDLSGGILIGKKYNLTETQLQNIAKICQKEQGTAKGAAAEASLMANRYEIVLLDGNKRKWKSFYDYVLHCNWWAPAKKGTYKSVKLKPEILNAVREVLIYGQRTLPFYVDEHDWVGDLKKITTNGKTYTGQSAFKNHQNYQRDKTKIYNKMGAIYTYYTHPTKSSDPFGYTSAAKQKIDSLNH